MENQCEVYYSMADDCGLMTGQAPNFDGTLAEALDFYRTLGMDDLEYTIICGDRVAVIERN